MPEQGAGAPSTTNRANAPNGKENLMPSCHDADCITRGTDDHESTADLAEHLADVHNDYNLLRDLEQREAENPRQ